MKTMMRYGSSRLFLCIAFLAFALSASAGERHHKLLMIAAGMFAAGNAADMATSIGLTEANPVLGRGSFGARQIGINAGLGAGIGIGCWWLTHRHHEEAATVVLFGGAAGHGFVAWHNEKEKP